MTSLRFHVKITDNLLMCRKYVDKLKRYLSKIVLSFYCGYNLLYSNYKVSINLFVSGRKVEPLEAASRYILFFYSHYDAWLLLFHVGTFVEAT